MNSHFFAYISKIRWVQRWGLKRNVVAENVMEHSWEVAVVAHALALIRNKYFYGDLDANAVAVTAMYHDCTEVITGDMPSPIKYHSREITSAYKALEKEAESELLGLLPREFQSIYRPFLIEKEISSDYHALIKAADTISALIKCETEISAGNMEFSKASEDIRRNLDKILLPEVKYFMEHFSDSYSLTLDELLGD